MACLEVLSANTHMITTHDYETHQQDWQEALSRSLKVAGIQRGYGTNCTLNEIVKTDGIAAEQSQRRLRRLQHDILVSTSEDALQSHSFNA